MVSKKYILLKLREIEKQVETLKREIKEHYGSDAEFYLDLTKGHEPNPKGMGL